MFYGLKCILTSHGKMPLNVRGATNGLVHLVPVSGTTAIVVGLAYFGFGLFIYFSDGNPPPEGRGWVWRVGRGLLRWGSLAVAVFYFSRANGWFAKQGSVLDGFLPHLARIVAFIAGFIALLSFLGAMFQREQVKRELYDAGITPLHVWWRPAAYWTSRFWSGWTRVTGFRVIYLEPGGLIHKGYCLVYRSFREDWRWGRQRVKWLADTITNSREPTQVWADSEILRPKLRAGEASEE